MKAIDIGKYYTRELLATVFVSAVWFLLFITGLYCEISVTDHFYISTLGLFAIFAVVIADIVLNSYRSNEKYREVFFLVRVANKIVAFLVTPAIFYLSVCWFLYFSHVFALSLSIVVIATVILLILLVHIKSVYLHKSGFTSVSKIVFDAINIFTFFMINFILLNLNLYGYYFPIISAIVSFSLFMLSMIVGEAFSWSAVGFLLFLSLAVCGGGFLFLDTNLFIYSVGTTIVQYLGVAFWQLRLSGETRLSEYLVPVIYALLAIVFVLGM